MKMLWLRRKDAGLCVESPILTYQKPDIYPCLALYIRIRSGFVRGGIPLALQTPFRLPIDSSLLFEDGGSDVS